MNTGSMRHRLRLQSSTVTRDSMGGEIVTWKDEITVWGEAVPLSGRELLLAQQAQSETSTRFCIRYRRDVEPKWRLLWEGKPYNILSVRNVDGRHTELQLECSTGLRGG